MNLEFPDDEVWCRAEKWPLTKLKKALSDSQQATAANGWYPIFFENHDQIRCVNRYFPEGTDKKKAAKAMATILFSLRGTPFIYEGQELGMANTAFARIEDYNDISTHGQYQLALDEGFAPAEALHLVQAHSRDNARTPMQWTTAAQAGFTTGTPWLPVHDDYPQCCAESEEHDADSVLWYYRRIQAERFQGEAAAILQRGRYEELLADDERIYAFKRILDDQAMQLKLSESQVASLRDITDSLTSEYAIKDNLQEEMLRILLKRFIILCTRIAREKFSVSPEREKAFDMVRQFYVLVDNHFKEKKMVQDYADMLHRSPKTLSNLFTTCGLPSPLRIIHERIEAEAKRLLLYSQKSAKEITEILGFEDQATFSRFFKKMTGESVSEYRKREKQE